ncbi:hypothetical protein EV356DRAFT_373984 [Viridothelium virens]|uniref:Uncharacterized protein n=1 Tax=Viridothelium virens TaxID=1048519 RepID=A0A6A6GVH2_VIRVR|nr:hypothetical protein EV356DRAFT_373984 [Viridothelium virens]
MTFMSYELIELGGLHGGGVCVLCELGWSSSFAYDGHDPFFFLTQGTHTRRTVVCTGLTALTTPHSCLSRLLSCIGNHWALAAVLPNRVDIFGRLLIAICGFIGIFFYLSVSCPETTRIPKRAGGVLGKGNSGGCLFWITTSLVNGLTLFFLDCIIMSCFSLFFPGTDELASWHVEKGNEIDKGSSA